MYVHPPPTVRKTMSRRATLQPLRVVSSKHALSCVDIEKEIERGDLHEARGKCPSDDGGCTPYPVHPP